MQLPPLLLSLAVLTFPSTALSEPIEGRWRLSNGETVTYRPCGAFFCSRVDTGRYAGKSVGRMAGAGFQYTGTVIDPSSDKTYEGRVEIEKNRLTLTGCVAKVFCRSQVWTR